MTTNTLTEALSTQGLATLGIAALIVLAVCLLIALRMWLGFIERMLTRGKITTTASSTEFIRAVGSSFPLKGLQAGMRPRRIGLPGSRKRTGAAVVQIHPEKATDTAS